jgi:uncharacterized protein (TIGR02118 family)
MVKLVLLFKRAAVHANFDLGYRRNLDLLKKMPGVQRIQESNVIGGPAGETAYHRIVEVFFENFDALDAALTSPEGVAAGKDLMAFGGSDVELLFVEVIEETTPKPLAPKNLQAYLDAHAITAEIVYPGAPTPTVPAAAEVMGIDSNQIVKSVIFLVDGRPFLVYGCGTRRVDPRKLAERLQVGRKRVKLANADQVLDLTGYAVGTVPPVGLKTPMAAYMDPAVRQYEVIYAGGGGIDALLKMTTAELLRVSNAEIAPMLEDEKAKATDEITEDES